MSYAGNGDKIVVFDLDETLGNFSELGMFWDSLENYYGHKLPDADFNELVDMFPGFLRPGIIDIIRYLIHKRDKNKCSSLMIYTNNQGPKRWVRLISRYFDSKLQVKTFDRIIEAFKVRGKVVEVSRTSHKKSVDDLIRCTKINPSTEICFLDDQYHPLMKHDNVYYINVAPYYYGIPYQEMATTYFDKKELHEDKEEFVGTLVKCMNKYDHNVYDKRPNEVNVDSVISKKIILHLEEFFNKDKRKNATKRIRRRNRKTRKQFSN